MLLGMHMAVNITTETLRRMTLALSNLTDSQRQSLTGWLRMALGVEAPSFYEVLAVFGEAMEARQNASISVNITTNGAPADVARAVREAMESAFPARFVAAPSTNTRPGLKQETLSDAPPPVGAIRTDGPVEVGDLLVFSGPDRVRKAVGTPTPGSNEMVANATRERLHHEVQRLGQGGTDMERSKADILRLVDGLHTLAVSGAPETSGSSGSAEAMRAACVRLAESHLATLHGHERVARDSGHEDEARHWAAEAETVHNLVETMRALPVNEVA